MAAKVPGLSLVNGYGPTEATVICTAYLIDRIEPGRSAFYPIGKPMRDTEVCCWTSERDRLGAGRQGGAADRPSPR